MTQKIYRLNGEYFGFIWQARFFDKDSKYIGWVDGEEVWTTDNEYLGELLDGKHVVRYTKPKARPQCKGTCPAPVKPSKPADTCNTEPRLSKEDYTDALEDY